MLAKFPEPKYRRLITEPEPDFWTVEFCVVLAVMLLASIWFAVTLLLGHDPLNLLGSAL